MIYHGGVACSLNRYVTASSLEYLGEPRATVPFSLDPIPLDLQGCNYMGMFPLVSLEGMVSEIHNGNGVGSDSCSGSGSGSGRGSGSESGSGIGSVIINGS